MENRALITLYFQITDIWKRFCEAHQELLELTCDEYFALIRNKLDELNHIVEQKQVVMEYINGLNDTRADLIEELNQTTNTDISSVKELISFVKSLEIEKEEKHLFRFNAFLVDTINKIKKQTEINQDFINRAMTSIDEVRESLLGKNRFQTYNSRGKTQSLYRRN